MRSFYTLVFIFFFTGIMLFANPVIIQNDNGIPGGSMFIQARNFWEESVTLVPDGPCNVKKIQIYISGIPNQKVKDTLWICGFPTSGNLWPTQYIWDYNSLIPPIPYEYDGTEGWIDIDVSGMGLRSDGFDKIIIQHRLKQEGPWFVFDKSPRKDMPSSWLTDPFTPNPDFYYIAGTLYAYPPGNFMARLTVEYDYPDGNNSMPPPAPTMLNVTKPAGLSGGGYVSVVDYDGDGWDDVVIGGIPFKNNRNGTFQSLASTINFNAAGTTWGDFDNDGDEDCYALRNGNQDFKLNMVFSTDQVYINEGNGNFRAAKAHDVFKLPYPSPSDDFFLPDVNKQDSIPNPYNLITPCFWDYDGDGWLDLFMANRRMEDGVNPEIYCPDQLWKNNKDGTFSNVTASSNISSGEPYSPLNGGIGYGYYDCYGADPADYNRDGLADMFVANYRLAKDNLFKNKGNGTFDEVGAQTGVQGLTTIAPGYFGHGMGCQWGDFNNNGYPDLCVGNLAHTDSRGSYSNPSLIFRNDGPPNFKFTNVQPQMVLKFHEGNAGVCWLDLDLDGLLDIWHGKYSGGIGSLYLNTGLPNYKLREITWETGCIDSNAWTAVRLDYDHDGDLDMIIQGQLFRNDLQRKGNWLEFRLQGNPSEKVSMDAYGSQVIVYAGGKLFYRDLMGSAAGSLCTQNSNDIHFGIGNNQKIDSVVIIYPNGKRNIFSNIIVNARYKVPYLGSPVLYGLATPALKYPINFQTGLGNNLIFECYPVGFANSYTFEISKMPDFSTTLGTVKNTDTKFTFNTLEPNTIYYWHVLSLGDKDTSAWSSTWMFYTGTPMPGAPVLKTPANNSQNLSVKPAFSWAPVTYNLSYGVNNKYRLEISKVPDFSTIDITYTDLRIEIQKQAEPLTPATQYFWRVRGENGSEAGPWSEIWQFSTQPIPLVPTQISPANGEINVKKVPTILWTALDYVSNYHLQIALDEAFVNTIYDHADITVNAVSVFGVLKTGTKYYWRIKAMNDGGESQWSETWNFTTVGVSSVERINEASAQTQLYPTIPNPASDNIKIKFDLSNTAVTKLSIYDALGREIYMVQSGMLLQGSYSSSMNVSNLIEGIYYCRLVAGEFSQTKTFVVIR